MSTQLGMLVALCRASAVGLFFLCLFVVTPPSAHAERNIPGLSRGESTEDMIDELMEAERAPLRRREERKEELQEELRIWRQIDGYLSGLGESARALYGVDSPFHRRHGESSNSDVITAQPERRAETGNYDIVVHQTAAADRFLSDSIPQDTQIPEGEYTFRVGEEEATVEFPGGRIQEFAQAINRQAEHLVQANAVRDTTDTVILSLEAQETGATNRMELLGETARLGVELGILEREERLERPVELTDATVTLEAGDPDGLEIVDNEIRLDPGVEAGVPVEPNIDPTDDYVLRFEYEVIRVDDPPVEPLEPPQIPGPDLPEPGRIQFEDIEIFGEPWEIELPELEEPGPPEEPVEDFRVISALSEEEEYQLPELEEREEPHQAQIPLADYADRVIALAFRNRNTHHKVVLRNIVVDDIDARGEYVPRHPSQTARDAQLELNGVPVTRSTNEIDDLIPRTTLRLHRASEKPVQVGIMPDVEEIQDGILDMMSYYNQLMSEINVLTRTEEEVLDQIAWENQEERERAEERLGMLQGNSTLMRLRSSLITIMTNSYPTSAGRELSMLAQIGIASDTRDPGQRSFDLGRLRGYMELDESAFQRALSANIGAVRQLFGADQTGDGAVDGGIAYEVEQHVSAYTGTGGLLATRYQRIENSIDQVEREMARLEDRLARREEDYRRDFGRMERELEQLEEMESQLDSLAPQQRR